MKSFTKTFYISGHAHCAPSCVSSFHKKKKFYRNTLSRETDPNSKKRILQKIDFLTVAFERNPNGAISSGYVIIVDMDITKKLIDLVSQRQLIFNTFHREHKIKTRWIKHGKTAYGKLQDCLWKKASVETEHSKWTGTISPESWPYFAQLSFLVSHVKHRKLLQFAF